MKITGGAEDGHSGGSGNNTHGGGWKIDFKRRSDTLEFNQYIRGNILETDTRSLYDDFTDKYGNIYVAEGPPGYPPHWDVLFLIDYNFKEIVYE